MSDILKIAAILFTNLSDAFLQSASEIRKLDGGAMRREPLSQATENQELVSLERTMLAKRLIYKSRDAVIVLKGDPPSRIKCRILKRIGDGEYLAYCQGQLKSSAFEITHNQILGFDPDS